MIKDLVDSYRDKYIGEGAYPFPSQINTNPEKKLFKEYLVQQARAMFSAHMRGATAINCEDFSYIDELRSYGSGNQDTNKYVNQIYAYDSSTTSSRVIDNNGIDTGAGTSQGSKKGYGHINQEIVSPAPKIRNMFIGMLEAMEQDIFVNNIDEDSGAKEEVMKNKAFLEAALYPKYKEMQKMLNVDDDIFKPQLPQDITIQELEYFQLAGGFKLNYARIMEKLLKYTEKSSRWQSTIKKKFTADIIDLNLCAGMCKYDTSTQQDRWQYIDPKYLIAQYSTEDDFNDMEYAGYLQLEKISNLIEKGLDRDTLKNLSRKYCGMFTNPDDKVWNKHNNNVYAKGDWFYDYRVPVFHAYWFDTDVKKRLKVKNKYDKERIFDLAWDEEVRPITKKQQGEGIEKSEFKTRIKNIYQVSWIIDSDECYDGGKMPFQSRKSKAVPELPIKVWRGVATDRNLRFGSIMEYIRPQLDQIQLNWLRLQNSMARATEDMYLLNLRVLSNLKMGGKELNEYEAFSMGIRSGVLPYSDIQMGKRYEGGAVSPITKIEGTSLEGVMRYMNIINSHIQMIHEFLGISPEQVGGIEEDSSVAQARMASMGSNNINRSFISGVFNMKQGLAELSSRRIQLLCKYNKTAQNSYSKVVGKQDVNVLGEAVRMGVEYGINLEPRPEAAEREELKQLVINAMQTGREGIAQIELDQAMYILEQLHGDGNIKEMRMKLSFEIKRAREEREAQQQRNIILQGQQTQQLEQVKQQSDIQKKQLDVQGEIAVENVKSQNDIKLERLKGNIKFKQDLAQKEADYDGANKEENNEPV
jgi:hypothetical protein